MSYFRGILTGVATVLLAYAIRDNNLALILINATTILINLCAEWMFND